LRASEVGLLRTSDLDFKKLRILVHRLKGSYSGEHPLQSDEAKAVRTYLRTRGHESPVLFTSNRGDPISRRTLDWLMKTYGAAANLPPAKRHFHVLKHSIATICSMPAATCGSFKTGWATATFRAPSSTRTSRRETAKTPHGKSFCTCRAIDGGARWRTRSNSIDGRFRMPNAS